ncbi:MAG TPA: hypothetical protein PLJ33_06805 [Peptococcaceae bacterium]|nr:hypothetical protein [Peptococcaceae bacterium]HPZ71567.1 hypothetical protein [Peptococcaceae bacterium]HQD54546.1 hypothetical protein [Peptococcaceae bacterium]
MASMQFRYDGFRRPEQKKMCFFMPRYRHSYQQVQIPEAPGTPEQVPPPAETFLPAYVHVPEEGRLLSNGQAPGEVRTPENIPTPENTHPPETVLSPSTGPDQGPPHEKATEAEASKQVSQVPKLNSPEQNKSFHEEAQAHQTKAEAHQAKAHAQDPGQHQVPPEQFAEVSAILIQHLANTEEHLVRIKERIDFAKVILDELLFKMDSISKIMEIVRANEVKSASLAEAQAVSYKTSKDSIDEFLELLQGPVFQKLLRQFFVQIFVGDRYGRGTNLGRPT